MGQEFAPRVLGDALNQRQHIWEEAKIKAKTERTVCPTKSVRAASSSPVIGFMVTVKPVLFKFILHLIASTNDFMCYEINTGYENNRKCLQNIQQCGTKYRLSGRYYDTDIQHSAQFPSPEKSSTIT
ncbi:hypothetical protein MJG53_002611 [Ovis ammon polii x Ovis aries]|uniref:Uncharacterized protein n=1 Tax=Ovis ammon polii x Ovis aries TaxID=2918886 RepID=A0ACB9VEY5_9CETA|nr:hypothetical protein MJT46_003939 [Ovis ammon polii x Ovis aries]KAI4588203.1 hypothetical protein MJG53_002611 [Ovis ammon polii x Ovis aries]